MSESPPRFELTRVFTDGTREELQVVPITAIPAATLTGRRGFLATTALFGAGVSAAAVLGYTQATNADNLAPYHGCGSGILAHTDQVNSLAFSPDGKTLASGSDDNTVKPWSIPDGVLKATLTGHEAPVTSVAFSRNGKWLASGSSDNTVKLWSMPSRGANATLTADHNVASVAFSRDGTLLASGCSDNIIKLWSVLKRTLEAKLTGHSDSSGSDNSDNDNTGTETFNAIAFSPDGTLLASGSSDRTITLWSMPGGEVTATLTGHNDVIYSIAFSPDGRLLASGSQDHSIKLWSVPDGALKATLVGQGHTFASVTFSPDGQWLASGSRDKTIRLWSMRERAVKATLRGHSDELSSVAFSPDGQWLASGSLDKTIRLWSMPGGNAISCLFDRSTLRINQRVNQYTLRTVTGQVVTYTMPCGSPIPAGATCICNCVPGTAPLPAVETPATTTEGTYCSCVPVCVCVPIC
jgi:WD40 repeat protein